jgi:hypothetical protein
MLSPRESRIAGRALARIDGQTDVGLAKIQQAAELQVERVQAIGYVGQQGMQVVALASQMEANLAKLVPLATTRLQAIGDIVSLEVADVISHTVRRVSR